MTCCAVDDPYLDDGGETGVRSICWLQRRFATLPLCMEREQFADISPIATSDAKPKDLRRLYALIASLRRTEDEDGCYFVDARQRISFCGRTYYLQRLIYMLCAKTYGHTDKIGSRCPCPVQSYDEESGLPITQTPTMTECPNAQRCCANPRHIYLQHGSVMLRKRNVEALDAVFVLTDAMRVEHLCPTLLDRGPQPLPRAARTQLPLPRTICSVPSRAVFTFSDAGKRRKLLEL